MAQALRLQSVRSRIALAFIVAALALAGAMAISGSQVGPLQVGAVPAQASHCPYSPWYKSPYTGHMWVCSEGWRAYWQSHGYPRIIYFDSRGEGDVMYGLAR